MARYAVTYFDEVLEDDIQEIPVNIQNRIERAVRERLATYPEKYGERLRKSLTGLWKIRVGDYRVVYTIHHDTRSVKVWTIAHRRFVYSLVLRRFA